MTTARCECCDLPVYSCGREADQRQRADQARRAGELRARGYVHAVWPGRCRDCAEPFGPGTLIHVAPGATWRAECCA